MIVTEDVVSSLLGRWEWIEYISEAAVILACAGEVVADLAPLTERGKKRLERVSTMVLVVSLTFGLTALIRTNQLSGTVIGQLGEKAQQADAKAVRALSDAARASETASEAKLNSSRAASSAAGAVKSSNAAESQAAASVRRTARLEQHLAWRTVTPEQRTKIRGQLLTFGGVLPLQNLTITMSYIMQDSESEEYAEELKDALDGLGADISGLNASLPSTPVNGVIVAGNPAHNRRANVLVRALLSAGIRVTPELDFRADEHTIRIFVGSKPHDQ